MLADDGSHNGHVATLRGEHRRRLDAMTAALLNKSSRMGSNDLQQNVEGGLYLWLHAQRHLDARVLSQQAAAMGVEVISGDHFFADTGGRQEFRLCFTRNPPPLSPPGLAPGKGRAGPRRRLGSRMAESLPRPYGDRRGNRCPRSSLVSRAKSRDLVPGRGPDEISRLRSRHDGLLRGQVLSCNPLKLSREAKETRASVR